MYGAGLRLLECVELRVKDVDVDGREIRVRDGKGRKDRVTVLPEVAVEPLLGPLTQVRALHVRDVERGAGWVALPDALARKYPSAGREWGWQWTFPASPNGRRATRCGTRSLRICSKTATTSGRSRSCWGIAM